MPNIKLNGIDAFERWGIVLQPILIPAPEPKTYMVDVPGRDGALDLTEALGEVRYQDRSFDLTFYKLDKEKAFTGLMQELHGILHGRKAKLVFDDDPQYYYEARVSIDQADSDEYLGVITMGVVAEPYKYRVEERVITEDVNGEAEITLVNGRMTAYPKIVVDAEERLRLTWGDKTYQLSAGTWENIGFKLTEGETRVVVEGDGTITFTWREGAL